MHHISIMLYKYANDILRGFQSYGCAVTAEGNKLSVQHKYGKKHATEASWNCELKVVSKVTPERLTIARRPGVLCQKLFRWGGLGGILVGEWWWWPLLKTYKQGQIDSIDFRITVCFCITFNTKYERGFWTEKRVTTHNAMNNLKGSVRSTAWLYVRSLMLYLGSLKLLML